MFDNLQVSESEFIDELKSCEEILAWSASSPVDYWAFGISSIANNPYLL